MKIYFLLFCFALMLSCQGTEHDNKDLVSKDKMVSLLIDIHMLETKVNKLRVNTDSARAIYNTFENKIFDQHEVDKATYEKSLQHYLLETKELVRIYQIVIDSLNARQKRASLNVRESPKKDDEKEPKKKRPTENKILENKKRKPVPQLLKKDTAR